MYKTATFSKLVCQPALCEIKTTVIETTVAHVGPSRAVVLRR